MTSERETATMFVVFLSLYKMVKEFLRYLYSFQNGAIPKISPKTTKNDPTLEPPGGLTFRPRTTGVSFSSTISFILRTTTLVRLQIPNRTPAKNPLVLVPSKNSDVRQTGSRNRRPSSFEWCGTPEGSLSTLEKLAS